MHPLFVLAEIGNGLRRNVTMAVAVVVTLMISLSLLGAALLMHDVTNHLKDRYYGQLEVKVYLQQDVTQAQRDALATQLRHDPLVERVAYVSKEQAIAEFTKNFADQKDLVASASGPGALPDSFQLKLHNPQQFEDIVSKYGSAQGVDQVYDPKQVLARLFTLLNQVQHVAYVVAVVSGLAALLTTFNTIRLSAFSRRREIGIMRLVGAGNLTIQLPFILEGIIAGLAGAGAAIGLLALFKVTILNQALGGQSVIPNAQWHDVYMVMPVIGGIAVVLAGLASWATSMVYVRV